MAAIVIADQISKWLVTEYIPVFSSVTVIPNLVDLVHVRNTGIAFGFLNDLNHAWQSAMTTGLAVVALVGILIYAKQLDADERWARRGLSLILAGAVGNLIDRARLGFVVDFVDVYWRDWHFWAFNVADSAISIGAVFILLDLVVPDRHVSNPV
jgi:signal peptidase II